MATALHYEVVIGLETHVQLLTKSKMFCSCSALYASALPNTLVCPVCLGMPGVLPAINEQAVKYTVMTGLALNCRIPEFSRFDRKNYPYPDLMKGYQISQYDNPLSLDGWLTIDTDNGPKRIGITRVHLEEDTAKLFHRVGPDGKSYSLIDVNRSGVPLMEVVSEPDIRSSEEARLYLMKLRSILRYLGVSSGNMEEGAMRCDANISLRAQGSEGYGAKVEVKNMNSFRAVYRALGYEIARQREALERGERIPQETRGWLDEKGVTVSQRSKEYAHDYRYFPEPDLPPLFLSREWVESVRAELPELPDTKRDRFISQFGLSQYQANLLTEDKAVADYFETCAARYSNYKAIVNWMTGELFRLLNQTSLDITQCKVTPGNLVGLLELLDKGTISGNQAKEVLEAMFASGKKAGEVVAEKGLTQISDKADLGAIIAEVVASNPQSVADYRSGKAPALNFLVGQVMKATRGKANPALVREILIEKLPINREKLDQAD